MGLRRSYHRHFGYHTRFHIAVLVTIVVVAYVVVPIVTRVVNSMAGYDPQAFEPKDFTRVSWLDARAHFIGLPYLPTDVAINIALFLLVVLVWAALVPPGTSRRR